MSENPNVHVDADWKREAEKTKEELGGGTRTGAAGTPEASGKTPPQGPPAEGRAYPPASLELLVQQLATEALFALGAMAHPATGKAERDLGLARHMIDTLGVLQEKTQGNLVAGEQRLLEQTLYDLRMAYVQATKG